MIKPTCLFVCGSACINVLARDAVDSHSEESRSDIIFDVGGSANNMAQAARNLGVRVKLLTALDETSPYARIILEHLKSSGVEQIIQHQKNIKTPAAFAYLDDAGKVLSSVSSSGIDLVDFLPEMIDSGLSGSMACIIDTSLSGGAINKIATNANHRGVPVYICVSTKLGMKKIENIDAKLSGVFVNEIFLKDEGDGGLIIRKMAHELGCDVVLTKDDGAVIGRRGDDMIEEISANKINHGGKNYIGAGDSIAAYSVIHRLLSGRPWNEALQVALQAVEEDVRARHVDLRNGGGSFNLALHSMNEASSIDHLTQLPNRFAVTKKIQQLLDRNVTFFVAMLDVDHFKSVNDEFGHNAGDEALQLIAGALSSAMRENDFCARWGGEEFLVVMSRVGSIDDAVTIAERIRKSVEAIQWSKRRLTVSIGVAKSGGSIEISTDRADKALYESKQNGRNRVTVYRSFP